MTYDDLQHHEVTAHDIATLVDDLTAELLESDIHELCTQLLEATSSVDSFVEQNVSFHQALNIVESEDDWIDYTGTISEQQLATKIALSDPEKLAYHLAVTHPLEASSLFTNLSSWSKRL